MIKYIKNKQEYIDYYDQVTIEECMSVENAMTPEFISQYAKSNGRNENKLLKTADAFNKINLLLKMCEMYLLKEETIAQWIKTDEEHDRFYENAKAPENVKCLVCGKELIPIFKDLKTSSDKPDRALFLYECPERHSLMRIFYDNGEEYKFFRPICTECKTPVCITHKDIKEMWKIIYKCTACCEERIREIRKIAKKIELSFEFETDRTRFCLDENSYLKWTQEADRLIKTIEKEENEDLNDPVVKLKTILFNKLEYLVWPILNNVNLA